VAGIVLCEALLHAADRDFPTGAPLESYGYKYPIHNLHSGNVPSLSFGYNGTYHDRITVSMRTVKPKWYEGIPADYKPAVSPLIPLWPHRVAAQ